MNWFSVLMGSVCLIGLYYLFRRLSCGRVAAAATAIYAFTPGFWLSSSYGMPTVGSEAFWVLAVLAFARALDLPARRWEFAGFMCLSLLLSWLSFTLKADLALSGGALVAVILQRSTRESYAGRKRAVVELFTGGCLIAGATAGTIAYSRFLTAGLPDTVPVASTGAFLRGWRHQFPARLELLLAPTNNAPITHAIGTLWFCVSALALLRGFVVGGPARYRALGVSLWAFPSILFWGLTPGNSARHNIAAVAPLIFAATAFLFEIAGTRARPFLLAAAVMGCSYLDTSGDGTVTPSFNVVQGSSRLQASSAELHDAARNFLRQPFPRKALIDSQFNAAYLEFEVLAAADDPAVVQSPNSVDDAPTRFNKFVLANSRRAAETVAAQLRRDDVAVCSIKFHFCDLAAPVARPRQ
ncbi:MAG TPA: glycosyltransferase family 39 protein [Polyangiaceae bacterium]